MNIFGTHIPLAAITPVALWLGSAAVRAMPEPDPMGSKFYHWLYNFAHIAGANFDKVK